MSGDGTKVGNETAAETPDLYARRFNGGDLEGLLELCDPEIAVVPEPGAEPRHGTDAAREMLGNFLAMRPTLKFGDRVAIEAGDTALVLSRWTLNGTAPDGSTLNLAGMASDVMRRGSDGRWRVLIDNPWGTA